MQTPVLGKESHTYTRTHACTLLCIVITYKEVLSCSFGCCCCCCCCCCCGGGGGGGGAFFFFSLLFAFRNTPPQEIGNDSAHSATARNSSHGQGKTRAEGEEKTRVNGDACKRKKKGGGVAPLHVHPYTHTHALAQTLGSLLVPLGTATKNLCDKGQQKRGRGG